MVNFLLAAQNILESEGKPLSYKQITDMAISKKILTTSGKTPQNTMRARLSEELRKNGSTSLFQRTSNNRFALRDWQLPEYFADEFKKNIADEVVVCLDSNNPIFKENNLNGIFDIQKELLIQLNNRDKLIIKQRKKAEQQLELKQIISYVILKSLDGKILTYTRGKYSSAHKTLLKGRRSIGFGGHVLDIDVNNLFGMLDGGTSNAALREISEELKIQTITRFKLIRVIHDCTSTEGYKHLGIVLEAYFPKNIELQNLKKELSINGVKFQSPKELWANFHLFEYWSQLIIKDQFTVFRPKNISTIVPKIRPSNSDKIVIVGEIATGKTSILTAVSKKISNCKCISARQCLIELLNIPDFNNDNRTAFQESAQKFITTKDGPLKLAKKISENTDPTGITFIDGIRNIATIIELKALLGDCIIVYVDCPRDNALNNFIARSSEKNSIKEFVRSREHPTELELPLIQKEADAILFNADELDKTIQIFVNWINYKRV